jgi:uncharacterized protein YxeA
MNKIIIIIIFILILVIFSYFLIKQITGKTIASYTYTKAFCNETNYCQDYEITCQQGQATRIIATGNAVQHSEAWNDPRNNNSLC